MKTNLLNMQKIIKFTVPESPRSLENRIFLTETLKSNFLEMKFFFGKSQSAEKAKNSYNVFFHAENVYESEEGTN